VQGSTKKISSGDTSVSSFQKASFNEGMIFFAVPSGNRKLESKRNSLYLKQMHQYSQNGRNNLKKRHTLLKTKSLLARKKTQYLFVSRLS